MENGAPPPPTRLRGAPPPHSHSHDNALVATSCSLSPLQPSAKRPPSARLCLCVCVCVFVCVSVCLSVCAPGCLFCAFAVRCAQPGSASFDFLRIMCPSRQRPSAARILNTPGAAHGAGGSEHLRHSPSTTALSARQDVEAQKGHDTEP
jgi:hypothetical protein